MARLLGVVVPRVVFSLLLPVVTAAALLAEPVQAG